GPSGGFLLARQLAVDQQTGHVQEADAPGEFLDRVAAVPEYPLLPVDVRDRAAAVGGVHEARVVGQQPEVVVGGLDLAQVNGPDRPVGDGQVVGAPGAAVGHVQHAPRLGGVRCHNPKFITPGPAVLEPAPAISRPSGSGGSSPGSASAAVAAV